MAGFFCDWTLNSLGVMSSFAVASSSGSDGSISILRPTLAVSSLESAGEAGPLLGGTSVLPPSLLLPDNGKSSSTMGESSSKILLLDEISPSGVA
jgi:hypothetical protein